VQLEHGRRVGQHRRHRIATTHAPALQRRGQLAATSVLLSPGQAARAMDQRHPLRMQQRRLAQEGQRRQRGVVGLVALQPLCVSLVRHRNPPGCGPMERLEA
jgi:hypothetical protein